MTEPTSIEALAVFAEEMRDFWTASRTCSGDFGKIAQGIRAYLAARPQTDLERRLRALAAACQLRETRSLLLEGACALAMAGELQSYSERLCDPYRARIAELERERDMLGNICASYEEKFKLQREKLDDLERELAECKERYRLTEQRATEWEERWESVDRALKAAEARLAAGLKALDSHKERREYSQLWQDFAQAIAEPAQADK